MSTSKMARSRPGKTETEVPTRIARAPLIVTALADAECQGHTGCMSSIARYSPADIEPGDWIKYRSGVYGGGRLAEVHALGTDVHSGAYAVTTEGNVLFGRILEVRRRPLNVVVFPRVPT